MVRSLAELLAHTRSTYISLHLVHFTASKSIYLRMSMSTE